MSSRDGVDDDAYDRLRSASLTREQCWAILDAGRKPVTPPPNAAKEKANREASGVRPPVTPPTP